MPGRGLGHWASTAVPRTAHSTPLGIPAIVTVSLDATGSENAMLPAKALPDTPMNTSACMAVPPTLGASAGAACPAGLAWVCDSRVSRASTLGVPSPVSVS